MLVVSTIPDADAVLSTMELSASGADHGIRVFVEERLGTRGFSDFTVSLGYYGLPAMGALVYAPGLVARDTKLAGAGAAALQAMTVTFATTVLLKGLTGRPFPNHGGHPESPDRLLHPEWAREWRGPLLENSAWPSMNTVPGAKSVAALSSSSTNPEAVSSSPLGSMPSNARVRRACVNQRRTS